MEFTCQRCHQVIPDQSCFCPSCGLPQLVYEREEGPVPGQLDRWAEAARDANSIEWRQALRAALIVGIPAGVLSSIGTPIWFLCLFWMAIAAAWAVLLYVRRQQPAWITVGAGVRIGLVTGLFGGWAAFAASGTAVFLARFLFGAGKDIDEPWQTVVNQFAQQSQSVSSDPQSAALAREMAAWLTSAQGRAGFMLLGMLVLICGMLIFSAAGGALGARILARRAGLRG